MQPPSAPQPPRKTGPVGRLGRWWRAGTWQKIGVLAALLSCACCSCIGTAGLYDLTPAGQQNLVRYRATATANAVSTVVYTMQHPPTPTAAPTATPVPPHTITSPLLTFSGAGSMDTPGFTVSSHRPWEVQWRCYGDNTRITFAVVDSKTGITVDSGAGPCEAADAEGLYYLHEHNLTGTFRVSSDAGFASPTWDLTIGPVSS